MKFDKKIIIIILVSIVAALFLEISDGERDIEKSDLKKPGYSGAEKNLDVSIYAGKNRIDTTITIEPEKYTAQETEELFFNVYEHLKKEILNDNASLDEIKTDLNFIEKLEDNPVSIEWFSSNYNLIGYDGKVYNDDLKKDQKEEVTLTANLQYMEYSSSYEIKVIVCGRELTHEEQLKKDIFYEIKCAQSDYNSDYVELPKEVDGEEVIYKKRESDNYAAAVLFCGISLAIFAHYHDKEKKNSYEKEKIKQMNCDYPEIVAKLSLLVGAGMTVRMAWEKIVVDYRVRQKSGSKKRYAYEFMSEGLNMLKSGKPQIYVYEEFGMKCGIKEYMKFSSLIVQNIKKGTKELALLLTLEAKDAFEERKNMAKKYGEEAGTKLLLPMIIMLIVVMAIIMVPALMSFSGY